MSHAFRAAAIFLTALFSSSAVAHSFGRVYTLPVPFWLYAWGAAAVVIASFAVSGFFLKRDAATQTAHSIDITDSLAIRWALNARLPVVLAVLSVGCLLLTIACGLFGTRSPYGNFNMTFFWIVFVLGFAYLTAVIGNLYEHINPWKILARCLGRFATRYREGLLPYPQKLGYWPAVAFYAAFIWIELFGKTQPLTLAYWLAGYSVVNLIGAGLFGIRHWFRYCEFFAVFLRLTAMMAPVEYRAGRVRLRWPFAGLLEQQAESMTLLLFLLFMLSSTAFDGLHEAKPWVEFYWIDLYRSFFQHQFGSNPLAAFPEMRSLYIWWQSFWLVASPFIYLAIYLLFIWLTKLTARSELGVFDLARRFAFSLLPIALVYHVTHYYTLLQTQGIKIIPLASDPFGFGWNLLGTAKWFRGLIVPDMATVWHVQVWLIVFGHVVSVVIAHLEALRTFPTHRQATLSQLPMLVLMVLFTTAGLWILSQPIKNPY